MTDKLEEKIIEQLAELEHQQWVVWASTIMKQEPISEERRERWMKLFCPYSELSEEMKEHDRKWARKSYEIFTQLIVDIRREERERVEEFLKDQMANCSQYRSNSSSFKACRIYNKQLLVVMNKLLNSSDKGKCKEHAVFISCDHVSYKCDICCKCGAPTVFNGKVLNSTDTTE